MHSGINYRQADVAGNHARLSQIMRDEERQAACVMEKVIFAGNGGVLLMLSTSRLSSRPFLFDRAPLPSMVLVTNSLHLARLATTIVLNRYLPEN